MLVQALCSFVNDNDTFVKTLTITAANTGNPELDMIVNMQTAADMISSENGQAIVVTDLTTAEMPQAV